MTGLRVLIVEDSDDDALLLLEELGRGGFDVTHRRVQTADAMRAALAAEPWDMILSDYQMPAFNGLGALAVLKETGIDVPLIIASGTIGEETAVEVLKAGACDFLLKGRLARLVPAIKREMREAEGRRMRRMAEDALSHTRDRMHFALTAAGVGFWESEPATGTMTWSEVLEELHGLVPGRFGGTLAAFFDRVHPDDRERVSTSILQSMPGPQDAPLEYRTVWPDGSIHWMAGIGQTFCSDSGHPVRAAGVTMDITARKNLEEQFRQAQKLEAIGGLAAGVAHDFNNLLTIVRGNCELLAQRVADDAEALQDVKEILHASASAAALTRQLLAFSRRQIVQPQAVNLNALLSDGYSMLRRLVEANVQIDLKLGERVGEISIDPGQLEQVLLNLVINARDAMPNGGVVTIETSSENVSEGYARAHLELKPGAYVLMSVSDTGEGMTPDVQARLFEPFFTTKERGRGTGLGLATVYGIVKQSRGHIWVYSEVAIGSTFKIYWPVSSASQTPPPAPAKAAPTDLRGSETILVVEDEAPLRSLTERILRRYGYTVLQAANGDDAERVCTGYSDPIHVVLIDVLMPGKSGAIVGEWMGLHRPEAKLIYVSGYTDAAISHHGVLASGATLLQKPYATEMLLTKIREALA